MKSRFKPWRIVRSRDKRRLRLVIGSRTAVVLLPDTKLARAVSRIAREVNRCYCPARAGGQP